MTAWEYVTSVESDSKPGERYRIQRRRSDGALGCDCHAFRFSHGAIGAGKSCRHLAAFRLGEHVIREVRATGGQVVSQSVAGEKFTFRRAMRFEVTP